MGRLDVVGRRKAALWLALGALLAALFGLTSFSFAQPSAVLLQKSSEASELKAIAQEQGYVRVIVQFASPVPQNQITVAPGNISNLRAQVAAAQNAIIADHFGSSAAPTAGRGFSRDITRFELTPGFGVTVNETELESLATDPRVKYITYNEMLSPTLDQSVPLIGMNGNAYNLGALGGDQVVVSARYLVYSPITSFLAGKVVAEACFSNNGVAGGNTLRPQWARHTKLALGRQIPELPTV